MGVPYLRPDGTMSSDEAINKLALTQKQAPDGTQMYVHPVELVLAAGVTWRTGRNELSP